MSGCFIDTMRPITPAETEGWRFFLCLHSTHWRAARAMFRRSCAGEEQGANLLRFVADTGLDEVAVVVHLEDVLRELAAEARR